MSVTVLPRLDLQFDSSTMYTTSLIATRSPFTFGSPKNSPRLSRATSPKPGGGNKCRENGISITSSFSSTVNHLVTSPESTVFKPMKPLGCQQCHENQTSGINSGIANLSIADNNTECNAVKIDVKLKDKILNSVVEPLAITSTELESKLKDDPGQILVVDCRSFISFNLCHIKNALNVGCADRLTKKRLASGKITLSQMIKCALAKEKFLSHKGMDVVVYDDNSNEASANDSSLRILLTALLREGKRVHFLKGGLAEFHSRFGEFCEEGPTPENCPLYSPTTPAIVTSEIDTAVASCVLPFLYIGNERDAANRDRLKELGITHVLNCTSHIPLYFETDGITYHRLPASDSGKQNLKQYFLDASLFIDNVHKEGGRVLIHCQAGVSRSATITMSFIMKHSPLKLQEVFKFVKSKRSIVAPNFNFMGQLMEFEQLLNDGLITRDPEIDMEFKCGS